MVLAIKVFPVPGGPYNFYLFSLTKLKDQDNDYQDTKLKYLDISSVLDLFTIPDNPVTEFDAMDHNIVEVSKNLLEQYSDVLNHNTVPIFVEGGGDCLFHAFQVFYPQMSVDEFRVKTINELCQHDNYYTSVVNDAMLDLVDDETVEEHVKRLVNNGQHSGILTISVLSSVLNREIQSIYPNVNDNDAYFEILNRSFHPRTCDESFINDTPLRIMWPGPEPNNDHI
ncbi:unnamed protein product [Didymodactylos carnosus]|uniref:OTU domain-containing protein n=1 Tax=Didymodactylos carnosus TaxID=1234261 RepID=A0A815APJ1_9BILA|nr:unnamed protein product [Didymodactylos carnosus]CAF4037104.1 unnamed protein product [Didymodactylos carnosus]